MNNDHIQYCNLNPRELKSFGDKILGKSNFDIYLKIHKVNYLTNDTKIHVGILLQKNFMKWVTYINTQNNYIINFKHQIVKDFIINKLQKNGLNCNNGIRFDYTLPYIKIIQIYNDLFNWWRNIGKINV